MVDTALELVCEACGEKFWYSGEKEYPETVDCPSCGNPVEVTEDG
jgi:rRNA maturation endonuclease Nob1